MSLDTFRFWNTRTRRLFAGAVLTVFGALVLMQVYSAGPGGLFWRGDFPAFYSAAVSAHQGEGARLYDPDRQSELQNRFFPDLAGRYLAFAYPPFFALALSPLANLTPGSAKVLYSTLQLLCAVLSFFLLMRALPCKRERLPAAAIFFSFAPLFTAVVGAQNAALSLLLMILSAVLLTRRSFLCDLLAGMVLGLWLFKPQMPLLFIAAVVLVPGRKAAVVTFLLTACVLCSGSLHFMGPETFFAWVRTAAWFSLEDAKVNGNLMVSFPGFFTSAAPESLAGGFFAAGALGSIALALYGLYRYRLSVLRGDRGDELTALFLLGALSVICSPHALYYELSLFLPAAFALSSLRSDRDVWSLISFETLVWGLCAAKDAFTLQPLGPLGCLLLLVLYKRASKGRTFV